MTVLLVISAMNFICPFVCDVIILMLIDGLPNFSEPWANNYMVIFNTSCLIGDYHTKDYFL